MVYIIIPVHNRIKKTVRCLESIYKQKYRDFSIIIVDDGSTDGTSSVLSVKHSCVKVLQGSGYLFWTGSVDLGIKYVLKIGRASDWVLLVNNDVVMESNVIERLVLASLEKNRRAVINALSVDLIDKKTIIKSGSLVKSWFFNITQHILHGSSRLDLYSTDLIKVDLLTGRCLLHPIEIFQSIGGYDFTNFPHYGGDDEFTVRACRGGYQPYIDPSAIVYLDNDKMVYRKIKIIDQLFGIRSSINIVNKWKFTKAVVPLLYRPSYYLVAVLKTFYLILKKR